VKIVQIIDVFAPVGGAQRSLLDGIELLEAAGHEVFVLHRDAGAGDARFRSARYTVSDILDRIREFDPDVVHVHDPWVPPALEPALVGRPVVHSLHDFAFACSTGSKYFRDGKICTRSHGPGCLVEGPLRGCIHRLDSRPAVARFRRIQRELPRLREAAGIIVHSRFMRDVALQNGLPGARVDIVPLYATPHDDLPARAADRVVAFAGRISPDKGLDALIEALASRPEAWDRLLVAGEGWDRLRCERLAHDRGIAERVEFLGHLDASGVRETFARAHVVAVPSRWPEPFGIVGLEAMAVGRPVVASGVGGIPEWLDDWGTGILVPPGDSAALAEAIESLLADPARAEELGAEGHRKVERFSPESHVERLLSVYERAIGRRLTPDARVA
jgi:glycosyltransferase involved in cell wall biosynthesis